MGVAWIGVDPGKSGGVALITNGCVHTSKFTDYTDISDLIRDWRLEHDVSLAAIEKVGSMPGQGVRSMFSFGENYGFWQGLFSGLDIPYVLVSPTNWQKKMLDNRPGTTKEKSVSLANSLYCLSLKKTHDGIADALHLARYAKECVTK